MSRRHPIHHPTTRSRMPRRKPLHLLAPLASAAALALTIWATPALAADAPSASIEGPSGTIKQASATYTFAADEPNVHF